MAATVTWDFDRLGDAPRVFPASGFAAPGVEPLFYEGEPYLGRPTRVFAWMGLPYTRDGAPRPGMVLLHGGGGTAFDEWVRIWNRRGYAAIAMDLCGCVPERSAVQDGAPHERHKHAGPAGWDASFEQTAEPVRDQWTNHAVAAGIRGRALLASQPGVDPGRIGVTGISWGGYLTCIVAGADPHFGLAVPVYGCGFLGRNSFWKDTVFPTLPRADVDRWLELWDPAVYLRGAQMPLCWVTGTNDFAYPMDSLRASAMLAPGERTLCVRVEMPHSHEAGWQPAEIGVAADAAFLGSAPLPRMVSHESDGRTIRARFESARPLVSAEVCFTRALGMWQDRKYNRLPATLREHGMVEALVPPATTVAFLNVTDDRGCVSSTPHEVFGEA